MKEIHNFKELHIWKMSMELIKDIYQLTKSFPKEELFCLTSQIRRSALSIPSNIAEGSGRGSNAQFVQFLNYAQGSAFELETQLLVAKMLNYHTDPFLTDQLLEKVRVIQMMTLRFKDSLKI
jgi:four helix bundle protein